MIAASTKVTNRVAVRAPENPDSDRARRRMPSANRCPMVSEATRNTATLTAVTASAPMSTTPAVNTPTTTPSRIHPTRSLIIAEAMVSWPTSRRIRRMSARILAMTGRAEMLIATPRNSAKEVRSAWSPQNASGISHPNPKPRTSGTTRLPVDNPTSGRPSRRSSPRSVSNPVTTSSSAIPSHATARINALLTSPPGKIQAAASGASRPKTDGPRMTPAASSPITGGWFQRCMTPPSARAAPSRTTSWTQKISRSCSGTGVSTRTRSAGSGWGR